jgi:DNA helicase II / ATP-dependent DNA helicase PcrA
MGRIIVVGDRNQSIYGFRGADITAMPNLQAMLEKRPNGCKVFPLSVCRRCPKSHIRLAQALVPDIQWCVKERDGVEAPEGEIYQLGLDAAVEMMKEGDMGLSRVNRVLIPVAYRLIKQKKKVIIRGRDIGAGLIALIKKLAPVSVEDLLFKVEQYEAKEFKKLLVAEKLASEDDSAPEIHTDTIARLSKKGQQKLENILDKTGCITALADGVDNIAVLVKNITEIFADFDDDGKPKDAIVLGTVHRTKGLEAHNVYMIDPENFPHSMATKAWERQQEFNLAYVGVTRAKFVVDKDGTVIEPGRLIFIGACPTIFRAEWLIGHAVYPAKPKDEQPTEEVSTEPVVMTDMEELRVRLVAFYVKNKTPGVVAQQMVAGMSDTHVRQCAMVMPI